MNVLEYSIDDLKAVLNITDTSNTAAVDARLYERKQMRLDSGFPVATTTFVVPIDESRDIQDYQIALPLLATRRTLARLSAIAQKPLTALNPRDLSLLDRDLLEVQEERLERMEVHPLHEVYNIERTSILSALRRTIRVGQQYDPMTLVSAEELTGVPASEIDPETTVVTPGNSQHVLPLIAKGLEADVAPIVYWMLKNPEANVPRIERFAAKLGSHNIIARLSLAFDQLSAG